MSSSASSRILPPAQCGSAWALSVALLGPSHRKRRLWQHCWRSSKTRMSSTASAVQDNGAQTKLASTEFQIGSMSMQNSSSYARTPVSLSVCLSWAVSLFRTLVFDKERLGLLLHLLGSCCLSLKPAALGLGCCFRLRLLQHLPRMLNSHP